jgi:hypothetical protein
MAKSVSEQLSELGASVTPSSVSAPAVQPAKGEDALVLVPAGFIADIVGGLSGTIGELAGGLFGNAKLGKNIGTAASPLIKLLPFQVIPPEVVPQSAGPEGQAAGPSEALVVVPSAFLGGILGSLGGKLLGGQVDKWFGGSGNTGSAIGGTIAGALGSLLPFQVLPPELTPASAGPGGQEGDQEPMIVVPAGFLGSLLGGVTTTFAGLLGNKTVSTIAETAAPFIRDLLPFQDVPPALVPASAGPSGTPQEEDRLIVVPASFFSSIVGGLASTIGGEIGGWFGAKETGATLGSAAGKLLEDVLPFHALPPALAPASTGPGAENPDDQLVLVPAGLFSGLLSGLAGAAGGVIGGIFGDSNTGKAIGDAAAPFIKLLPFQVVAPAGA